MKFCCVRFHRSCDDKTKTDWLVNIIKHYTRRKYCMSIITLESYLLVKSKNCNWGRIKKCGEYIQKSNVRKITPTCPLTLWQLTNSNEAKTSSKAIPTFLQLSVKIKMTYLRYIIICYSYVKFYGFISIHWFPIFVDFAGTSN